MHHEDLAKALAAVADRLVSLASEDAELRAELRRLAQVLQEAAAEPDEGQVSKKPATEELVSVTTNLVEQALSTGGPEEQPAQAAQADSSAVPAPDLPELTLGRAAPSVEPTPPSYPTRWATTTHTDLPLIEARCRLKAEGARWAATRRRLMSEGANFSTEIDPIDRDIIARAKTVPDCFLWMCHPSGPSPADPRRYEDVAGCFEAVADALTLIKQIQDDPDMHGSEFEQSLDLLAEAQSALRFAIAAMDGPPTDTDQMQVFHWLKATASENQIFIQRYMRADDPADPTKWSDVASRIEAVDTRLQETRRRGKQRRKLLNKVRHKLSLVPDDPEGAHEHWRILGSAVDELVNDGMPPSNRELRELLLPAIDDLPELNEIPQGFGLVLREIDRFMATCPPPETTPVTQPTPQVREVARLLSGRSMVLIGGERRPASHQAIKDTFGLRELNWIETREHESIDGFEPYIARAEVGVVLLAIRWSSHSFGEVQKFCDRHGKPLVRLPGGYNPNQVAAQIMAQCSERLGAE